MKLRLKIAAVAALLVAGGTAAGALAATSDPAVVPNGIRATEAYSDSISGITATWGTSAANAIGTNIQVPDNALIQFGATSTLNAFPGIAWHHSVTLMPPSVGAFNDGLGQFQLGGTEAPIALAFTVQASELSPGLAKGIAFVTVAPGDSPNTDSVTITLDLLKLDAPQNNGTSVTFNAEDSGGNTVSETMANLPAGVTFSGNVLGVGTAVAGHYPLMIDTATDPQGARATEGFTAVVGPDFLGVPKLSGGRATEGINASRENVSFIQSNVASCDHFTIVGPGAINGHQGWVPAHIGLNVAVYGGLLQHHGYTVYYQPVSGPADCSTHSTDPWPGSHWGYVFFVTA